MRPGFERLFMSRSTRVCVALLAGVVSTIAVIAIFGVFASIFGHFTGPFSIFEAAIPFGSVVAIRVLRSGQQRRSVSNGFR